ncbi:MAG TPA: BLUF domain-containing protein [Burkholderiaceae bacterium]
MLVRLMYASRAVPAVDQEELLAILKKSKANNPKAGVTGVLCLCLDARVFMQVLEGGRSAVNRLYNRIAVDPRHTDVELLAYEEIAERRFAGWSMGQVNMARLNPALLLKYSECARLDPYAVSGRVSVALFDELVATASVMGQG